MMKRAKTLIALVIALCIAGIGTMQPVSAHGLVAGGAQVFEVQAGEYPLRIEATVPTGAPTTLTLKILPVQAPATELTFTLEAVQREQGYRSQPYQTSVPAQQALIAVMDIQMTYIGNWDLELTVREAGGDEGFVSIPVNILPVNTPPLTIPLFVGFGLLAISLIVSTAWLSAPAVARSINTFVFVIALTSVAVLGTLNVLPGLRIEQVGPTSLPLPYAMMRAQVTQNAADSSQLQLTFYDGATGLIADDLVVHHQALVHFIMLNADNSQFFHLHPARVAPGVYAISLTEVPAGQYTVAAEIERVNSGSQVLRAHVEVPDTGQVGQPAVQAVSFAGNATYTVDDYQVTVTSPTPPSASQPTVLTVAVAKQQQPVAYLDYWLGMLGHMLIRSQDNVVLGHVHAASTMNEDFQPVSATGNTVNFVYDFPYAGEYHIWIQVQVDSRILTIPLHVEVAP